MLVKSCLDPRRAQTDSLRRFANLNRATSGEYVIQAHYYGNNGNRLIAETHVTLTVVTKVGRPDETIRRYNIVLANPGDVATIARVRF